ncbi:MAG: amino acid adenylation domain-containing protein [Synechococcales bacterium]|nr:amino acid adenylation domain-containing protein [Synechococcales bacterium]
MDNLASRITNLSPEQLAQLTQQLKKKQQRTSAIPVQSRESNTFPLSFAQQRLWLLHQLQPESAFYHLPSLIRITGPLDVAILERSLTALCDRHEPLRTVFRRNADGEPVQIIQPVQPWVMDCVDLQNLSPEQQQQQIERHAHAIAQEPFNLEQGPLLRSRLLHLGSERHILCLCLHHIIADGCALGIIIHEFTALYEAFAANQPNPLPPLSVQYVDYGVWQRQWLEGENSQRHIEYWQQQLQGAPTVLELPTDYPRPAVQSTQGARQAIALGSELTQALKSLGQTEGATLFMTVLAALKVLLYRYTAQTDLVVGAPVANRNQAATEQLIGVLINTLALRTQLNQDWSFRQLLRQVRDVVIEANAHQDLPFEKLVDILQPQRSRSYAPLLQVLLTVQDLPFQTYPCGDLTLQPEPIFTGTTQFDLVLNLGEAANGLEGWLEYNTDVFSATTMQRLSEHLKKILAAVVANPEHLIAQISLLTAQEQSLLQQWNHTATDYPQDVLIHRLFEAEAAQRPEALAVAFGTQQLTYGELNAKANQVAHSLQSLGVGSEVLVGLCVERSLEMVIGLLAILKAGGAYLPLDPAYPSARLEFMLNDAPIKVLLTQQSLLASIETLAGTETQLLCLDSDWQSIAEQPRQNLNPEVNADNLAYVIYTSGSTGTPKGVEIQHSGLSNLVFWHIEAFGLSSLDNIAQFASFAFDASGWEIWPCLATGASLHIVPDRCRVSTVDLQAWFTAQQITVSFLPTPILETLLKMPWGGESALRVLLTGGDRLQSALPEGLPFKVFNNYGPTENTVVATSGLVESPEALNGLLPSIGRPIANTHLYLLDANLQPVPIGIPGELYIGGAGLARGYLNRPELTAERFIDFGFSIADVGLGTRQSSSQKSKIKNPKSTRLYKTGDLVRYRPDGTLAFLGRIDHQVKLRGFRIELGEIEAVLMRQDAIQQCVVLLREVPPAYPQMVAYIVVSAEMDSEAVNALKQRLKDQLPDYMVPSFIVPLETLPLTPNGKVNRQALPAPDRISDAEYVQPSNGIERTLTAIWESALQVSPVGINHNFFDLGGNSILLIQVHAAIQEQLNITLPIVELFTYPTVRELSVYLTTRQQTTERKPRRNHAIGRTATNSDIAIVAMTGRFPGAKNLEQFWQNLKNGVESISFFSDDELLNAGIEPSLLQNPDYVKANPILDDIDLFDADFFDITPKEAEILDPQQRLFLECAWEALEQAGYDPDRYPGAIGVYAGVGINAYLLKNLIHRRDLQETLGDYRLLLASDKDFLPTRVAYKLNLTGAAINVQTACSTSLVAVHLACQSLINGETDMVLAGGASIRLPQVSGYLYQEGMILSPDGHCRAFDANAGGTIGGSGVAVVMLKRLEDAIADGDHCYAVIKGSAINNDGSRKVGYTAPGVEGQATVIEEALTVANVEPDSIGYIETHGTGTPLGDPIEIAALTRAFHQAAAKQQACAIGSLKTNVGHLDAAAGVAGLIKASLSLKHQLLLPSLNFESANPKTGLESSPFYVNTALKDWGQPDSPRRAGVSSFGIGGTNAHVILEEAPQSSPSSPSRRWQPLLLSAKTASALDRAIANLADHLQQQTTANLADVAYTLSCGRQAFGHRCMVVCRGIDQAIEALNDPSQVLATAKGTDPASVVFLFPGQGTQHVNMGLELYQTESIFRQHVDDCAERVQPLLKLDLRQILYPQTAEQTAAAEQLQQTAITQPALFVIEYALAHLWLSWGVEPAAMLGHSIGEYVAACLAGVFSLEEALALVVARGQLMQQLPAGAMLSVSLSSEQVEAVLETAGSENGCFGEMAIAVLNEPDRCVVSGPTAAIAALEQYLVAQRIGNRRLHTSHAFHSPMMDPILADFRQRCQQVNFQPPQIPYLSNLTGTWITTPQATDPDYWVQHLRQPVRFAQGVTQLCQATTGKQILLEVGPGRTLSTLAKRNGVEQSIVASMRHPQETKSDQQVLLSALGKLWLEGATVDWFAFYGEEHRHRVPLPTYPFERQRYWLDATDPIVPTRSVQKHDLHKQSLQKQNLQKQDLADWFYLPTWKRRPLPPAAVTTMTVMETVLVFVDEFNLAQPLLHRLEDTGCTLIQIKIGETFTQLDPIHYCLNPQQPQDYDRLLQTLGTPPRKVLHLWTLPDFEPCPDREQLEQYQALGFYSLLFFAQAWNKCGLSHPCDLVVITRQLSNVTGEEPLAPAKATLLGAIQTIPQEISGLTCRYVDVAIADLGQHPQLVDHLVAELEATGAETAVAYRAHRRWIQDFEPYPLGSVTLDSGKFRSGGVYLITGGLGGLGLSIAQHLAQHYQPTLILLGRSPLPAADTWDHFLTNHDPDDSVVMKIKTIRELEANGANVHVATADVCNLAELDTAITEAVKQVGAIHGVIHSAGVLGGGLITLLTQEETAAVMAPKVQGTFNLDKVLDKVLGNQSPDFVVLCSSLTAVVGAVGQTGYCAANAFLDAYANYRNPNTSTHYLTVNWDSVQQVGMAVDALSQLKQRLTDRGAEDDRLKQIELDLIQGILPQETGEVLERLLVQSEPWALVSTRPLHPRLAELTTHHSLTNPDMGLAQPLALSYAPGETIPDDQVEAVVMNLFQTLLGIEKLGINDNFFELGGDSLIGTQLLFHLRQTFGVNIPIATIFDTPTIGQLVEVIKDKRQSESTTDEFNKLSDLLEQVEAFSDEEINALLET